MLIEDFTLEIQMPPCKPGAERVNIIAHLNTDISSVLPYLNATLRGSFYHPEASSITWKKGGHNIFFGQNRIGAANFSTRSEAEQVVQGLIDLVNRTWLKRDDLEPSFAVRKRPDPMSIYKLLPRTNCKQCAQETCFNFALKLIAGHVKVTHCPPLMLPDRESERQQIEAMLADLPAFGT